jgi:hypothetical protein
MDSISVITLASTIFGAVTWLLGISYFLGRNAARLDGLADAYRKTEETLVRIFAKLEELGKAVPHICQQIQSIAELKTSQQGVMHRLDMLEGGKPQP